MNEIKPEPSADYPDRITLRTRVVDFYRRLGSPPVAVARETVARMLGIDLDLVSPVIDVLVYEGVLAIGPFFGHVKASNNFHFGVPASYADRATRLDEKIAKRRREEADKARARAATERRRATEAVELTEIERRRREELAAERYAKREAWKARRRADKERARQARLERQRVERETLFAARNEARRKKFNERQVAKLAAELERNALKAAARDEAARQAEKLKSATIAERSTIEVNGRTFGITVTRPPQVAPKPPNPNDPWATIRARTYGRPKYLGTDLRPAEEKMRGAR